jgi:hypothetical protein
MKNKPSKSRAEYLKKWRDINPEKAREYYQNNKEKSKESSKKWQKENHKKYRDMQKKSYNKNIEKRRIGCRKWYAENKEKVRDYSKKRYAENSEKILKYGRKYSSEHPEVRLKSKLKGYGLTVAEFNAMVEKQNGVCAVCGKSNLRGARLCVDHKHETGKVRGLLCVHCNAAIGLFCDDINLLASAISYLKE